MKQQSVIEEDWLDETVWVCPKCGNTGNWRKGEDYEIWHLDGHAPMVVCCKCWYYEHIKK